MVIEILNPANPSADKIGLLIRQYLKLCCKENELNDLTVEFNRMLENIDRLIQKKSGGSLDMYINITAAYLAGKFNAPVSEIISGIRTANIWINKELSK